MHCPRCGQQQVSEELKFCSRCGFPLALVSELLINGGYLPQLAELYKPKKRLTKRNGIFFSLMWMIFFLLIMTPFWGIIDADELAAVSAIIGIFGGLMWLIASLFLLKNQPVQPFIMNEMPAANLHHGLYESQQRNLPPQQSQPIQSYVPPANSWKAPNTGEFTRPPSVTERTTKLLQKEED